MTTATDFLFATPLIRHDLPNTGALNAFFMVLFPSWLKHSVRPYRGSSERISVAFNIMVRATG